ncbi:MAG: PQQ-dependent sugar dehydrogenase [Planctomycetes bacterium]|nr:PQQ-dependent sugar dehydrogenase [Planctomycetota bacterium]
MLPLLLCVPVPCVAPQSSLPNGFARQVLCATFDSATAVAATPDGRVFVGELGGDVWTYQNGAVLSQPLIHVPVSAQVAESAGLLGLELDPDFAQNGWLYVYYTSAAKRNRVGRFTVVGASADPASEFVVWENVSPQTGDHNGGGLCFGPDGKLYISTGDQFVSSYSQDLTREDGKLLRVAADGSIPSDNPYVNHPFARKTIYASGLRNPFRLAADWVRNEVWIGDVGGNSLYAWEEIQRALSGANYGWPFSEGQACYVSSCAAFASAAHAYRHDDPNFFTGLPQASVTMGVVYDSTVFPLEYRGNLFYADYANRWIRRLTFDAQGQVTGDLQFADENDGGRIVDMVQGADGALYFLNWGPQPLSGELVRIAYQSGGNAPPVVVATATPTAGLAPLDVTFDGSASFDPDVGPQGLQFAWDFGDGQSSSSAVAQHTYTADGNYSVVLAVGDGAATSTSTPFSVRIGNPPTPTIDQPAAGATYRAGDALVLSGSALDAEDGALPASALVWRVELVHEGHVHPVFGPIQGVAQTTFPVPNAGHPPEHTHYVVHLGATDSSGLVTWTSRALVPETAMIALDTYPSGIPITIDGQPELTPRTYESLVGYQLGVEAPRSLWWNGELVLFVRWTGGGPALHTITTPPGGKSQTAVYGRGLVTATTVAVSRAENNAEFDHGIGRVALKSPNDPLALRVGRAQGAQVELAVSFQPAIPRGATVVSAYVEFTADAPQQGHLICPVRAYDVGSLPDFVAGSSVPLSEIAPLTSTWIVWQAGSAAVGQPLTTDDLSALVQSVVDRPDWAPGQTLGLVFLGSASTGSSVRTVANFDSTTGAKLVVDWAVPPARVPHPPSQH